MRVRDAMHSEPPDILLVTDDPRLRRMVLRHCPPELRCEVLSPAEFAREASFAHAQVWCDLSPAAASPVAAEADRAASVLFFSDSPPKNPGGALLVRKPLRGDVAALLWAGAAQTLRRARAPLPAWIERFHELELRALCSRVINELPQRLGYQTAALYLLDDAGRLLRLCGAGISGHVELAVPASPTDDNPLARAMHAGRVECGPGDRCFGLRDGSRAVGVVRLVGANAQVADGATTDAVLAFVSRALTHARRHERAVYEARVDGLTGLHNRRWLQETLGREIGRTMRRATPLSLVMLDLDNMKAINDACGHVAGDAVLRHVAAKIRQCLRQSDSAIRAGGDEFVLLLSDTTSEGAAQVAERTCRALESDAPTVDGSPVEVRASWGVAAWRPGWSAEQLLAAADEAMYTRKRTRNGTSRQAAAPLA